MHVFHDPSQTGGAAPLAMSHRILGPDGVYCARPSTTVETVSQSGHVCIPLERVAFFVHGLQRALRVGAIVEHDADLVERTVPRAVMRWVGWDDRVVVVTCVQPRGRGLDLARHCNDVLPVVAQLDRKSTRLNSSHANISYAVF